MNPNSIRDKLVGSKEERAVSPVIGVILMVAITVILAAVIAAFVMDLGDMSESANAGVEFDESGEYVTPQVIDEGNTDSIYVEVNSDGTTNYIDLDGNGDDTDPDEAWEVGDSLTMNSGSISDEDGEINEDPDSDFDSADSIDEIIVYGEVDGDRQVVSTWEP